MKKIKKLLIILVPYAALCAFIAGFIYIGSTYSNKLNSGTTVQLDKKYFIKPAVSSAKNFSLSSINIIPLNYKSIANPFIVKNNLIFSHYDKSATASKSEISSVNMQDKSVENLVTLENYHIGKIFPSPDNKKFIFSYFEDSNLYKSFLYEDFSMYNLDTKSRNDFPVYPSSCIGWLKDSSHFIGSSYSYIFLGDFSKSPFKENRLQDLDFIDNKADIKYLTTTKILVSNASAYFISMEGKNFSINLNDLTVKSVNRIANIVYDAEILNNDNILFSGYANKQNSLYIYNPFSHSNINLIDNSSNLIISSFSISPDNKKICYVKSDANGNKELHAAYIDGNKLNLDSVIYKTTDSITNTIWTNDSLKLVAIGTANGIVTAYKFNFKNIE